MKRVVLLVLVSMSLAWANGDIFSYLNKCSKANYEKLQQIFKKKPNLKIYNKAGQTPLTKVAQSLQNCYYNQPLAKSMIDSSDILDMPNKEGDTPLLLSLRIDRDRYFSKLLIKEGAEVNAISKKDGKTPLMLAAINGDEDMVRILSERHAKRGIRDKSGKSAFDYALQCGNTKIIQKVYADKRGKFAFLTGDNKPILLQLTRKGFHLKDKNLDSKKILFLYANHKIFDTLCKSNLKPDTLYLVMINFDEKIDEYKSCKSNVKVVKFNEDFYNILLKALRWRTPPMFLLRDSNGRIISSGIDMKTFKKIISR